MMFLYVFVFFQLCPKTDYHWSKKVDALQNGLARETQFHPKPSKSNVQIVSTLKIIQYPPSQSTWHFLQNGWGREEVKSVNFQWHFYALPQYSPLFLYFKFFSYKMTFCKAPDVTHSVEEIPQGMFIPLFTRFDTSQVVSRISEPSTVWLLFTTVLFLCFRNLATSPVEIM